VDLRVCFWMPLLRLLLPLTGLVLWGLWRAQRLSMSTALFVWTYQQNQQSSSSVFLSQQTSEQCFQHNKPAKRTGCTFLLLGSF
jgi:hypothetical protein